MSAHPSSIPIRTLRNDVSAIIKRVEAGESFDVTRHGTRVARLVPAISPSTWPTINELRNRLPSGRPSEEFVALLRDMRSDPMRNVYDRPEG